MGACEPIDLRLTAEQTSRAMNPPQWLAWRGFRDILQPIASEFSQSRLNSAMYEACYFGNLPAVKFILANSGHGQLRAVNPFSGRTPIQTAAVNGHVHVARWLAESCGCLSDLHLIPDDAWRMSTALECSLRGHLSTLRWLDTVGCLGDIRARNAKGLTALALASNFGHVEVVLWLILRGGADNPLGYVDSTLLDLEVCSRIQMRVGWAVQALVRARVTFMDTVLLAVNEGRPQKPPSAEEGSGAADGGAASPRFQPRQTRKRTRQALLRAGAPLGPPSSLAKLFRPDQGLAKLVAAFAGIPIGRAARNLRDASEHYMASEFMQGRDPLAHSDDEEAELEPEPKDRLASGKSDAKKHLKHGPQSPRAPEKTTESAAPAPSSDRLGNR